MSGSGAVQMNRAQDVTLVSLPEERAFEAQFGGTSESISSSGTESTVFVKKLLAVAVSNVAYLRAVMPTESFSDRYLGDLHLKIIRTGTGSHPNARKIVDYVSGCFEAIDKRYLRTVTLWFHEHRDQPEDIAEAYIFSIVYTKDEANLTMSHNKKLITKLQSGGNIKETTVNFLKTLIGVVETLDPLPMKVYLRMRLTYYDDITPVTYEPQGFHRAASNFVLPRSIKSIDVGGIKTNHHAFSLHLKTHFPASTTAEEEDSLWTTSDGINRTFGLDHDQEMKTDEGEMEVEAETSRSIDPRSEVGCICGGVLEDGVMIVCEVCQTRQHGICYGVFSDSRVTNHVCVSCVKADHTRACPDPSLTDLSPGSLKRKALYRRALLASAEPDVEYVSNRQLRDRLSIDRESAQELVDKMISKELLETGQTEGPCNEDVDNLLHAVNRETLERYLKRARKSMTARRKQKRETQTDETASKKQRGNTSKMPEN